MTLSQKTCLSVTTNNFGGKWVVQMHTVERLGISPYHPEQDQGMAANFTHLFLQVPEAAVVKPR